MHLDALIIATLANALSVHAIRTGAEGGKCGTPLAPGARNAPMYCDCLDACNGFDQANKLFFEKDGPQSWQIGFTQATWIPAGTGRVGELQQIAGANLKDPCHALCDQCRTGESEEFVQDGSYMNVRAILSSLIALPPPRPMYPAAADDRRVQMSNLDCAPQPGDNVAQHCKNPGSIQVTIRGGPYPVVKFPRAC